MTLCRIVYDYKANVMDKTIFPNVWERKGHYEAKEDTHLSHVIPVEKIGKIGIVGNKISCWAYANDNVPDIKEEIRMLGAKKVFEEIDELHKLAKRILGVE